MKIQKMTPLQKNRINKFALYGLLFFVAFAIADLTIIYFRDRLLPDQAPPKKSVRMDTFQNTDRSQYSIITSRNLFSSKNEIPEALRPKETAGQKKNDDPVPSALPITLIGTLVHSDPMKSVAAVEIKSKNMSGSFTVGAEMEGLAKLEKVERGIIYFRNLNNGALEYIEMNKGNSKVSFDSAKPAQAVSPALGKEVQSLGNNTFKIKRSDLNKHLNDLSTLLMQARALPNRDPNTGEINGYRLVDYQPGSIFEQLGLPRGTLITSAGGEPVNSIQSAMEMFNKLKTGNHVEVGTEQNGVKQTIKYNIE